MLQAEDARPTTEAGLAPLREGLQGQRPADGDSRDRAARAARDDPLIAPALNDGVGIRAEAANALAQMARTPAAVAEVQKLLLARAATDASLNTWESWGEIAAALGRLPYDTAAQVPATEAVLLTGTARAGFDERRRDRGARRIRARPRIAGAHRPRQESCRRSASARGICCDGRRPRSGPPPIRDRR